MDKKDIAFKNETKDNFLRRCVFDPWIKKEYISIIDKLSSEAKDTEEFIDLYLNTPELKYTQAYAELIKRERPELRWKAIRSMFGTRCFKTISDVGSVKVGTKNFTVLCPNGRGDGETRVAIFNSKDSFNDNLMNYFTNISGKFNIFEYDCGSSTFNSKTIEGTYEIYYYDGLVAFVKFER